MLDDNLFIAKNDRPAITPGALIQNWLFPSLVAPNYVDLRAAMDWARATPIYANFRVATAFDAVASNFLRFAVYVDSVPTFANVVSDDTLCIARGPDLISAGLNTVGVIIPVAVPPLNDLAQLLAQGKRYLTLGLEAYVPTTDWSAGGIDAFLTPHPVSSVSLQPAAGY